MEAVNGAMAETLKGVASSCPENPQAHRPQHADKPHGRKGKTPSHNTSADDVQDGPECKRRKEGHPEARKGVYGQRDSPLSIRGFGNKSCSEGPAVEKDRHAIKQRQRDDQVEIKPGGKADDTPENSRPDHVDRQGLSTPPCHGALVAEDAGGNPDEQDQRGDILGGKRGGEPWLEAQAVYQKCHEPGAVSE